MSLLFQFREDQMSQQFESMARNIFANQVPAAPLNMHGLTLKETESIFHGSEYVSCFNFRQDRIGGFEVNMANYDNNTPANPVPAA